MMVINPYIFKEYMYLPYAPTTELGLALSTTSGQDWSIDWGDGVFVDYASAQLMVRTKTFGTDTSGVARIRAINGLEDIDYFRITEGGFDIENIYKIPSVISLQLNNLTTGDITKAISVMGELSYVRLSGTVYFNYGTKNWKNGMKQFVYSNYLSTSELDQLLIDFSEVTWEGAKRINLSGQVEVRSSASDAAVATLQGMGVILNLNT